MTKRAAYAGEFATAVGAETAVSRASDGAAHSHALANALAELMRRGVAEPELKGVISLLAEVACRLTGADYSVVVARGGSRELSSFAGYGIRSPAWRKPWSMVPNSATSLALDRAQTLVIRRLQDRRHHRQVRYVRHRAEGGQTVLVAPLPSRESLRAVLHVGWRAPVDPVPDQVQLIETMAAYGGIILDNAQARAALEASERQMQELSRKLVEQHENERRSLSLELHDEVGQLVTAARYILESARRLPPDQKDEKVKEAQQVLADVISEIRALSLSLRPPMLDELGLVSALDWHVEHVCEKTGLHVEMRSTLPAMRLHPDVEGAAFRIVQESLTNVMRYAPGAQVHVELRQDGSWLFLSIEDLGPGFDVARALERATMGLTGMRYRAENLGGRFEIASEPGAGTRVTARLPFLMIDGPGGASRHAERKVAAVSS